MGTGGAQGSMAMPAPGAAGQSPPAMAHGGEAQTGAMDINDVEFDAYLANDRTLDDPDVVRVERGGRVRLRIINAASATNFVIDLGTLRGALVAVDGNPVVPLQATRLPLGIAQRMDLELRLPAQEGAWPVLALREYDTARTGIVLATQRGAVRSLGAHGDEPAEVIGLELEARLVAREPLTPRAAHRRHVVALTGTMNPYAWGINGRRWGEHQPLEVRRGERVELVFENRTPMPHPMHLHGAHFQVAAIDNQRIAGAVRDTVMLPANATVTVAFDADNPGRWALHCHNLYHLAAGIMTEVRYL
jgi:FtsP/CotA-like multicopper oxidase with cupredoxin domain